jgi:hypothetical protein
MFLYVRKSFLIFKIVLACIAFLASIIALLGTSQNSMLLTQESGKQLAIIMALVFAIITIVEAFMAPPEAIVFGGGGKGVTESPLMDANPVDAGITEPEARRRAA